MTKSKDTKGSTKKNVSPTKGTASGQDVTGTQSKRHFLMRCCICSQNEGQVMTPCECGALKAVHFKCIRNSILRNQSTICVSCQTPYVGLRPVYLRVRVIPFYRQYVAVWAYRVLGIPMFAMLLLRLLFLSSSHFDPVVKYFWMCFAIYSIVAFICLIIFTIKGMNALNRYNETNTDMIDVELVPK